MPQSADFAALMAVRMKEVVCMAAYNTLSEVLYLKKNALVNPRSGPAQSKRREPDCSPNAI